MKTTIKSLESETCSMCDTEKKSEIFIKTYAECSNCNTKKGLKRYYDKKDKLSNQQKIH